MEYCPFCEGHEDKTPHEILAYRDRGTRANDKGWRVRVVPNRFPALQIEGDLHGSAAYKKHLVRVYVKRAIDEARNSGR